MHRTVSLGIFALAVVVILTQAAPAAGQTSTTGAARKVGEAGEAVKKYTMDKKADAVAYAKKLVSDLDVKIKELEAQVTRDTSAAKADLQRQLNELKSKRTQAAKKLDELGKGTAESWESVKGGFAEAYKDLHGAYDKAAASVRK